MKISSILVILVMVAAVAETNIHLGKYFENFNRETKYSGLVNFIIYSR